MVTSKQKCCLSDR